LVPFKIRGEIFSAARRVIGCSTFKSQQVFFAFFIGLKLNEDERSPSDRQEDGADTLSDRITVY